MPGRQISPRASADASYILQLALCVQDLQVRSKAVISKIYATYNASSENEVVLADATAGAFAVVLPFAKVFAGYTLTVKKVDASANAVTITAQSGETVDGAATKAITTRYASYTIVSSGTEWHIL